MLKSSFTSNHCSNNEVINLNEGAPSKDMLISAHELICKASQILNEEVKICPDVLAYAESKGSEVTRSQIATFLSNQYNDIVSKDKLLITNGATVALHHIMTPLFSPQSRVTVISSDPYYPLAMNIFKNDLHCNLQYIASNNDGLDLTDLEEKLKDQYSIYESSGVSDKFFACCLYLVPTYNNPVGLSYTSEQCEAIVDLVHKYNALVICDDVYNLLQHRGSIQKRLVAYDYKYENGCVISNGSFSKVLMPAIRVGWLEANKKLIDRIAETDTLFGGGCINQYSSLLIAYAIKSGLLNQHLENVVAQLKERVETIEKVFDENLPHGCHFHKIDEPIKDPYESFVELYVQDAEGVDSLKKGGYFIWLSLPRHLDAVYLGDIILEKHKVKLMPGKIFSNTDQFNNCIRICFGRPNRLSDIENGCLILCKTIKELL